MILRHSSGDTLELRTQTDEVQWHDNLPCIKRVKRILYYHIYSRAKKGGLVVKTRSNIITHATKWKKDGCSSRCGCTTPKEDSVLLVCFVHAVHYQTDALRITPQISKGLMVKWRREASLLLNSCLPVCYNQRRGGRWDMIKPDLSRRKKKKTRQWIWWNTDVKGKNFLIPKANVCLPDSIMIPVVHK